MRIYLFLLATSLSFHAISQSICGTANEGGSVTLTAPTGMVFTSVTFASYGTPIGSCGSFAIDGCHASSSQSMVETKLIGNNTVTISATNDVFGDPCGGTVKRLFIEAVYGSALPLHLISFSCATNGQSNLLQWKTADEVNTLAFALERSVDGIAFSTIQTIPSNNRNGTNHYAYTDNSLRAPVYYYRLKMIDKDGHFTHSKVIQKETLFNGKLQITPNPVTADATIAGINNPGYVEIINLAGATMMRTLVTANTLTVNLASYPAGLYILKYTTGTRTTFQKLVKK